MGVPPRKGHPAVTATTHFVYVLFFDCFVAALFFTFFHIVAEQINSLQFLVCVEASFMLYELSLNVFVSAIYFWFCLCCAVFVSDIFHSFHFIQRFSIREE